MPLGALLLRAARGTLGANAIAAGLNQLGLLALLCLVATLACTPVKILTGWSWPIRLRRTLGLLAFFYGCLHGVTYAGLDQGLNLGALAKDLAKRPFILLGFTALMLMVPLALTSTAAMVKRLGFPRWKRLHRLAYLVGVLGVLHFFLRVKKDTTEPLVFAAVLGLLFALRITAHLKARRAVAPAAMPRGR